MVSRVVSSYTMVATVPDEVLLKIFSLLSTRDLIDGVRLTCERWSALSYDRSLWKITLLRFTPSCGIKGVMHHLTDIVEDLTLEDISHSLRNFIYGPKYRNLKALRLHGLDIPEFDFAHLIYTYPLLEQLIIIDCRPPVSFANSHVHICLLSRLRHLEIDQWRGHSIPLEHTVFANMPDLMSLKLKNVYLDCIAIDVLQFTALKLKTLVLGRSPQGCDYFSHKIRWDNTALEKLVLVHTTIDDDQLIEIAKHSPNLRSLSLKNCQSISEQGIIIVTGVCKQLESLRVDTYCWYFMSNVGWWKIVYNCPLLRKLQLPILCKIGNDVICHLAVCCPKLEVLKIPECHVTDESINAISLFSTQLRVLDISSCKQVTGAAISNMVVNCKRLTSLCLRGCSGIKDLNFNAFYEKLNAFGKTFNTLSEIYTQQELLPVNDNIKGAMFIQTEDVEETPHANLACAGPIDRSVHDLDLQAIPVCSQLSVLDLSYTKITPSSLVQVALHCPDLEHLLINSCSLVTEESVQAIVKRCRRLKELELSCKHDLSMTTLSDSTLRSIARFSDKLENLRIRSNSLITSEGIREVIEKCKSLESFSFDTGPSNAVTNDDVIDITANIIKCEVDSALKSVCESDSDSDSDPDSDSDSDSDDNAEFPHPGTDEIDNGKFSKEKTMHIMLYFD